MPSIPASLRACGFVKSGLRTDEGGGGVRISGAFTRTRRTRLTSTCARLRAGCCLCSRSFATGFLFVFVFLGSSHTYPALLVPRLTPFISSSPGRLRAG